MSGSYLLPEGNVHEKRMDENKIAALIDTPAPPTPAEPADKLREASALIGIVEGIAGTMQHGTWCDEKGMRLKDTPEWVAFYNAARGRSALAAAPAPQPVADREALVEVIRETGWSCLEGPEAIALLARGLRLPTDKEM